MPILGRYASIPFSSPAVKSLPLAVSADMHFAPSSFQQHSPSILLGLQSPATPPSRLLFLSCPENLPHHFRPVIGYLSFFLANQIIKGNASTLVIFLLSSILHAFISTAFCSGLQVFLVLLASALDPSLPYGHVNNHHPWAQETLCSEEMGSTLKWLSTN